MGATLKETKWYFNMKIAHASFFNTGRAPEKKPHVAENSFSEQDCVKDYTGFSNWDQIQIILMVLKSTQSKLLNFPTFAMLFDFP